MVLVVTAAVRDPGPNHSLKLGILGKGWWCRTLTKLKLLARSSSSLREWAESVVGACMQHKRVELVCKEVSGHARS